MSNEIEIKWIYSAAGRDDDRPVWPARFEIILTTTQHHKAMGKVVKFSLFQPELSPEESKAILQADGLLVIDNEYYLSQVDQTFSQEQVDQLREYFIKSWGDKIVFETRPARIPGKDGMSVSCIAVGGPQDFYGFCDHEDYNPAFKVWGYYDLRATWEGAWD